MIIGQQVRNANLSQDVMTLTMTTMGINKDIRDVNSKIKSGSNDNIIDIDEDDERDIDCKFTSGSYNNDNIIEIDDNEEQDITVFFVSKVISS